MLLPLLLLLLLPLSLLLFIMLLGLFAVAFPMTNVATNHLRMTDCSCCPVFALPSLSPVAKFCCRAYDGRRSY